MVEDHSTSSQIVALSNDVLNGDSNGSNPPTGQINLASPVRSAAVHGTYWSLANNLSPDSVKKSTSSPLKRQREGSVKPIKVVENGCIVTLIMFKGIYLSYFIIIIIK
jgi:hypothetical protein